MAAGLAVEAVEPDARMLPDEELELARFPWSLDTTPEHQADHLATTSPPPRWRS